MLESPWISFVFENHNLLQSTGKVSVEQFHLVNKISDSTCIFFVALLFWRCCIKITINKIEWSWKNEFGTAKSRRGPWSLCLVSEWTLNEAQWKWRMDRVTPVTYIGYTYIEHLSFLKLKTYAGTSNTGNTAYVPERGELVAAQFSEDQCWYRAGVKAVNLDGSLLVTYLDYGNSEEVPVARVRRLQTNMPQLPLQVSLGLALWYTTNRVTTHLEINEKSVKKFWW